jgi:hypothetical protein
LTEEGGGLDEGFSIREMLEMVIGTVENGVMFCHPKSVGMRRMAWAGALPQAILALGATGAPNP